jgi:hypothetical protein
MWRGLAAMLGLWAVGALALRVAIVPAETCPSITSEQALAGAREAAGWIARAQKTDGSYVYEYNLVAGRELGGYNIVRHAGVTMSLYQLATTGDEEALAVADRGLAYMEGLLVPHDDWVALAEPTGGSDLKLGASALMLAGLAQRRLATEDPAYDGLMRQLARFLLALQQPDGSMLNSWNREAGAPYPEVRSKYATGEAFWALTLLQRIFPGERWDLPATRIADYLALYRDEVEHQKFPPWADQWAAYGLGEMAEWPVAEHHATYARSLAERFGFLVRVESRRSGGFLNEPIHGVKTRAAGLGTWSEGLDSLWRLASADPRLADLRGKIGERAACAAAILLDRQVTAAEAAEFPNAALARGAWYRDNVTRMDDQQHALSGLLAAAPILAERARHD